MAVPAGPTEVRYVGNGVTTVFTIPFLLILPTDLDVFINGVEQTSGYLITGAGNPTSSLTFTTAPALGADVYLVLNVPFERLNDYQENGDFLSSTVNRDFDRIWQALKQLFRGATRALMLGSTDVDGSGWYRAKGNGIRDLADPIAERDGVNLRSMRAMIEQALAGVVGGAGWFLQIGVGAVARTFQSKMRDVRSVKDFGATGLGVVEDTNSFLLSGPGSYVPDGKFLVNALQVDLNQYYGPGVIYTTGGAVINLQTDVAGSDYKMRYIMDVDYGGHLAPIYEGAHFAPQGLAYHRDPVTGTERMFISQSVGPGFDWGPDEFVRITEFALREDGGVQPATVFTSPIRCSHAHLSAITDDDGKLYMYQSGAAPIGTVDLNAGVGKGWSKVEWKGAATATEVQNFLVWGPPGSGHRYQNWGKGCAQVSQDGRYVILIGINYSPSSGGRTLFVYDRKKVEAMANPLDAEPVYTPFPLPNYPADGGTAYQGETCDGRYVYVCWGTGAVFGRRGISVYTLSGDLVRHIPMEGVSGLYTTAQLLNGGALGEANAFEPEGITIRGDEIFVTYTDFWREAPDIVSHQGLNYANISIGNVGQPPNADILHWKQTSRAPTLGAWNAATVYGVGATTYRRKKIFSIRPKQNTPDELPCNATFKYPFSVAQYPGTASVLINASFDFFSSYRVCAHVVTNDIYPTAYDYRYGYTLAVFDGRQETDADNTVRMAVRMSTTGGSHVGSLIVGDGTSIGGSNIALFSATSPSNPGGLRLTTSGVGDFRLMLAGATQISIAPTELVMYQTVRPINTNLLSLGNASRVWTTAYLQTAPVVSSDARLKTPIRSMEDKELAVGRRLARELGFYKWLCSIDDKGEDLARWHTGMTVQRAIKIFEEEGLDPFAYGAVCHDVWGDAFETVDPVMLGSGRYAVCKEHGKKDTYEEIMEEWAPASERQIQWAGDKYSFREPELHALMIRALAHDQDQIMLRLDALETGNKN